MDGNQIDGSLVDDDEIHTRTEEQELHSVAYRHKNVRNFKVGRFEFKNHILTIGPGTQVQVQKDVNEFKNAWRGLQPADKNAIVQLRVQNNELRVMTQEEEAAMAARKTGGGAIRGSVGSQDVTDRPENDPVKAPTGLSALNFGRRAT